jgi:hypothetical protein
MEYKFSLQADDRSAGQEISCCLCNMSAIIVSTTLSHLILTGPFEPAHTLTPLYLKMYVNVIPSLAPKSRKQFL